MQLKRDLPLTVLVDFLLQILFVVLILFVITRGSDDNVNNGNSPSSPEILIREIQLLKAKIAALEIENKDLWDKNAALEEKLAKLEGSKKPPPEVSQTRGPGPEACRTDGDPLDPPASVTFRYVDKLNISIEEGEFYARFSSSAGLKLTASTIALSELGQTFGSLISYKEKQKCVFRARLLVGESVPFGEAKRIERQLSLYFRTSAVTR